MERMELKAGETVVHKMTGENLFIIEVGPKFKDVLVPDGQGGAKPGKQKYLSEGLVRVRLMDMRVIDVYDYEIIGIDPPKFNVGGDPAENEKLRTLLMEKNLGGRRS